jgi:hypothetical protein
MAETSGDVFVVPTRSGNAVATRMGRTEAGQSRWCIVYPWGVETFYGTAEQAIARMTMRAGEREAPAPRPTKYKDLGARSLWAAWLLTWLGQI